MARQINSLQEESRDQGNGSAALIVYPKENTMMKRAYRTFTAFFIAAFTAAACSSGGSPEQADYQEKFGVRMAKINLWREAMFRFKRAVDMNPNDALAHNNLAVAYEANGDFEGAAKEYREAIRLDKTNQFIQKNYSRFVEFNSRNRKRQQRPAATVAGPAPAAPAETTSTASPTTVTSETVPADAPPPTEKPVDPPPLPPQSGSAESSQPATPPASEPVVEPKPPQPQPNPPGVQA